MLILSNTTLKLLCRNWKAMSNPRWSIAKLPESVKASDCDMIYCPEARWSPDDRECDTKTCWKCLALGPFALAFAIDRSMPSECLSGGHLMSAFLPRARDDAHYVEYSGRQAERWMDVSTRGTICC